MKVLAGRQVRRYAFAILLEAVYVLTIAGLAFLVALVAEAVVR